MPHTTAHDTVIGGAIRQLRAAGKDRDTLRDESVRDAARLSAAQISRHAFIYGIGPQNVYAIIELLTEPCFLEKHIIKSLIDSLLPNGEVPKDAIIRAISSLGEGQHKPTYLTQALLLRWIFLISSIPNVHSALAQLYAILFNCVNILGLRVYACRILTLITRRKHVKPYRIQILLELWRNGGNDPHILKLLYLYKEFYPDVLIGELPISSGRVHNETDSEWTTVLMKIRHRSLVTSQLSQTRDRSNILPTLPNARRKEYLPSIRTYQTKESSITIDEIENVQSLVLKMQRLELPNNLVATLTNKLLQDYISFGTSDESMARIESWLRGSLLELLEINIKNRGDIHSLFALLDAILTFIRRSNILLSPVEEFLKAYLRIYPVEACTPLILDILSMVAPNRAFSELQTDYFSRIDNLMMHGSDYQRALLLRFYCKLLNNWIVLYRSRSYSRQDEISIGAVLRTTINHVDSVCIAALENSNGSVLVLGEILSFYEAAVKIPVQRSLYSTTLPSDWLVYGSVFAGDAASFSRICGIISGFKKVFMAEGVTNKHKDSPRDNVDHFNGYLMDISNCLWRNRAFRKPSDALLSDRADADNHALGCHMTSQVREALRLAAESREEALTQVFSLSHSAILSLLATDCFRDMEDREEGLVTRHGGPVSQKSLGLLGKNGGLKIDFKNYKLAVLKYMEKKGLLGVCDLMYNTMVSLKR